MLQIALWVAVLLALAFALWPNSPAKVLNSADKLQHFGAFFTLAALGGLAYPRLSPWLLLGVLAMFGVAIELAQFTLSAHRQAEWEDFLSDVAGAACGVWVASRLRSRRNSPAPRRFRRHANYRGAHNGRRRRHL